MNHFRAEAHQRPGLVAFCYTPYVQSFAFAFIGRISELTVGMTAYSTEENRVLPVGWQHRPQHAPYYLRFVVHLQINFSVSVAGLQSIPSARHQHFGGLEIDRMQMCIGRKS
uniref:Uncharacterized protein n=1 Tax=Anopheles farauti TaxID=69004 RepID=A0A182Q8Z2_9DIPT